MSDFESKLAELLNSYSKENESDTPDFILATYLAQCLSAYNNALQTREKWYGRTINEPATI